MKIRLSLVALVIFSGATFWVATEMVDEAEEDLAARPNPVKYYMEIFERTSLDENGLTEQILAGESWVARADAHEVVRPHLIMHKVGKPDWYATSERAQLPTDGDRIILLGKAEFWWNDENGSRVRELEARDVNVWPESKHARTAGPVVIRAPSLVTTGTGMFISWEDGVFIQLFSGVKTVYERN